MTLDDFGVGGSARAIGPAECEELGCREGLGRALQPPPGLGAPSRFEHVIWKTGVERRGTAICWGLELRVWTNEVSRDDRSGPDLRVCRLPVMNGKIVPLPVDRWEPIWRHPHPYSRGVVVESEKVTGLRHRERVGGVRWRSDLAV